MRKLWKGFMQLHKVEKYKLKTKEMKQRKQYWNQNKNPEKSFEGKWK